MRLLLHTAPSATGTAASTRRASILFLVLFTLVLLALFTAALLYTARLETIAADNSLRTVQNRLCVKTGLTSVTYTLPPTIWSAPLPPSFPSIATSPPSVATTVAQPPTPTNSAMRQGSASPINITTPIPITITTPITTPNPTSVSNVVPAAGILPSSGFSGKIIDLSSRLNLVNSPLPLDVYEKSLALFMASSPSAAVAEAAATPSTSPASANSASPVASGSMANTLLDAARRAAETKILLQAQARAAVLNKAKALAPSQNQSIEPTPPLTVVTAQPVNSAQVRRAANFTQPRQVTPSGNLQKNQASGTQTPATAASSTLLPESALDEALGNCVVSLETLRQESGISDAAFSMVAPAVTTWSSSYAIWKDADDKAHVCATIATTTGAQFLQILAALYPAAPPELLTQYALNVVDRATSSTAPTQAANPNGDSLPLLGFKPNPVISQVCSDVVKPDGDVTGSGSAKDSGKNGDKSKKNKVSTQVRAALETNVVGTGSRNNGEFLQITNPFPVPANLAGWRLEWPGGSYALSVTLAPRSSLVITNNISDNLGSSANQPGTGSFYAVFNAIPASPNQLVEYSGLNLPKDAGLIQLYDPQGNLADYLQYSGGKYAARNIGNYRTSYFNRIATASTAVPFQNQLPTPSDSFEQDRWNLHVASFGKPCQSAAELLNIPLGNADPTAPWFPALTVSERNDQPDLRLLDPFVTDDITGCFDESGNLAVWEPDPKLRAQYAQNGSTSGTQPNVFTPAAATPQAQVTPLSVNGKSGKRGSGNNGRISAAPGAPGGTGASAGSSSWGGGNAARQSQRQIAALALATERNDNSSGLRNSIAALKKGEASRRGNRGGNTLAQSGQPLSSAQPASLVPSSPVLTSNTTPLLCGKINLNTASPEILQSLPGLDAAIAGRIIQTRDTLTTPGCLAFNSLSAFAGSPSVWQGVDPATRLTALGKLLPCVTFNSASYLIEMLSYGSPLPKGQKKGAPLVCRGLLVYRDGGWSLLDWRVYDSTQHPILTTREEQDNTSTSGLPPVASATSTAKPTGVDILPLPVQPASSTPHQRPGTARTRQSVGPQETAPAQEPARRDDSSRTPQDTSHSRVNAKAGR